MSDLINFSDLLQCNLKSFSRFGRTDGSTIWEAKERTMYIYIYIYELSRSYKFQVSLSLSLVFHLDSVFPLLCFLLRFLYHFTIPPPSFTPPFPVPHFTFLLVMNPPRSSFYLAAGALRGTGAENCDFIRPNHCTYTIFFLMERSSMKNTYIWQNRT